jgi:hypothetical protein
LQFLNLGEIWWGLFPSLFCWASSNEAWS